jgi:hypothetical protein
LKRVTTCAMEYRGGKEQKIWTWSGLTSMSSMVMSYQQFPESDKTQ